MEQEYSHDNLADSNIRLLVPKAVMHSYSEDAVFSTLRMKLPTNTDCRFVILSERSSTNGYPRTGQIVAGFNEGFIKLAQYILSSAKALEVPIYALDLETNDRELVGTTTVTLNRSLLAPPKIGFDDSGSPFLDFVTTTPTED